MRTIAHLYDTYETAQTVVNQLEAAGFSHENVSIVANQAANAPVTEPITPAPMMTGAVDPIATPGIMDPLAPGLVSPVPLGSTAPYPVEETDTTASTGAGTGATIGTILGGGAGLLAGIGALAIPGVGPVVAAGWLIATLTGAGAGAAAGGLLGALTGAGVAEDNAHVYAEGVRRGSTLVTVRADDARVGEAEEIMGRHGPVDIAQRGSDYRTTGNWARFDDTRGAMTTEEIADERARLEARTGL